jgi:hypothetical protein
MNRRQQNLRSPLKWGHVPVRLSVVSLVEFVRLNLGAGRPWLAWSADCARWLPAQFLGGAESLLIARHPSAAHPVSVNPSR